MIFTKMTLFALTWPMLINLPSFWRSMNLIIYVIIIFSNYVSVSNPIEMGSTTLFIPFNQRYMPRVCKKSIQIFNIWSFHLRFSQSFHFGFKYKKIILLWLVIIFRVLFRLGVMDDRLISNQFWFSCLVVLCSIPSWLNVDL